MPARQTERRATLRARGDVLRMVAVADTHSAPHPSTRELIAKLRPDAILHAGDIGDASVLAELSKQAPVWAVRGNIDPHDAATPDVLVLDVADSPFPLRVYLTHIAAAGVALRADVARRAEKERASLVVFGHSHIPFIGQQGSLTLFNPGSVGPRRFTLPIVFGVIEVDRSGLHLRHVSCETGTTWMP